MYNQPFRWSASKDGITNDWDVRPANYLQSIIRGSQPENTVVTDKTVHQARTNSATKRLIGQPVNMRLLMIPYVRLALCLQSIIWLASQLANAGVADDTGC